MNWPDVTWDWSGGTPAPCHELRVLVLAALAKNVLDLRDQVSRDVFCADCKPGRLCADHGDHAEDLAVARQMEAAYMRVRGIGSDGAMLELLGGLTP
jgi:hypothetical protein